MFAVDSAEISLYIEVFIICPRGVIKTLIWVFCLQQPQDGNISTAFVQTLLAMCMQAP